MPATIIKTPPSSRVAHRGVVRKLEAIGWGLFFVWLGIAFLVQVGWGIGLLGVGVITVGMQFVRKAFRLDFEAFWMGIGILFLAAGLWELFTISAPFVPLVLLAIGAVILWFALRRAER